MSHSYQLQSISVFGLLDGIYIGVQNLIKQNVTSLRGSTGPMTQLRSLMAKLTITGNVIKPLIACMLHVSFTPLWIFITSWLDVHLSARVCNTHNQPCRFYVRSWLKVMGSIIEFHVRPITLEGFSFIFWRIFASVRWCAIPVHWENFLIVHLKFLC